MEINFVSSGSISSREEVIQDESKNSVKAMMMILLSSIFLIPYSGLLPFMVLRVYFLGYCYYTILALAFLKVGSGMAKLFLDSCMKKYGSRLCIFIGGFLVCFFYLSLFTLINNQVTLPLSKEDRCLTF